MDLRSAMPATTPVETASGTNVATMSPIFRTEAATIFAHHPPVRPPRSGSLTN
jgi:hypothetical protein